MNFNRQGKLPANIQIPMYVPKGVSEGLAIFNKETLKGKEAKFLVYYDPDIDGLMAGLIMQNYLEKLGYTSQYKLNSNRSHGFSMTEEEYLKYKGYTIIAVDFSITPEEFDKILSNGMNLINIDHHEIDEESFQTTQDIVFKTYNKTNYGVIINNQYKCEPENFRFLSGAGMVMYFVNYLSKYYNVAIDIDYIGMTGISLLSDIRAIETDEPKTFLKCLYKLDTEYMKFLQWVVTKEARGSQRFEPFGVPTMNRNFIDFTFSPLINSLLRANKGEDALKLLKGDDFTVNEYKNNDRLYSFRNIQKGIIKSIMDYLKEEQANAEIQKNENTINKKYSSISVCALPDTFIPQANYNISNYIGVACSKIKDDDKTGVIFVEDSTTHMIQRGSVRGGLDGVNYLDIFTKNGVPCAGHQGAFGILPCDSRKIPFDIINKEITEAELIIKNGTKSNRKVCEVPSISVFLASPQCKQYCQYNTLVRDNYRIYLRYTGNKDNIKKTVQGKLVIYTVEQVQIKSFDDDLDLETAFILPMFGNGTFIDFTLRKKFDY